ncbi:MAG: HAMP domain-containing sensor histidine kinase [Thermodesulfobacteriota bacterium]
MFRRARVLPNGLLNMPRRSSTQPTEHTILVVDDQEETLISVGNLLHKQGHEVLLAESGERALELIRERELHLILVDYFMPRMTGEELVREIRVFDPLVQIILQTGYSGNKPPREMLAELDIQGYHDKANGPEELLLWVDVGLKAYRLIKRLRERERLQAELVANVSHEFRTPLNVISGYSELLIDGQFGKLPIEALEPLRAVEEASRNLAELVSDFLSYARIEAGVQAVGEQRIAVDDLVAELSRLARVLLEEKPVEFRVDVEDAPELLVTDSVKLRTILRNLITNAAKFTREGSIKLGIHRRDGQIAFVVEDTGPGIRGEDLEVIFEPFRQAEEVAERAQGGIGLGLTLARRLAWLLGGDLGARSEIGRGSIFTLLLPGRIAASREAVAPAASGDRPVDPTGLA